MESFQWNDDFVTGLSDVDEQHKRLVDIINTFGNLLAENQIIFEDIRATLEELSDYAQYHFREEEVMMTQIGVSQDFLNDHIGEHQSFLHEVTSKYSILSKDNPDLANNLLDFLVHWLAYHILGTDQFMARQIEHIKAGASPRKAYQTEEQRRDKTTEPLLIALKGLFEQVTVRNKELFHLNQTLEEKVAERTKELSDANLKLKELSLTDTLTRLPNRRHAIRSLASLWEESVKSDMPLVCMMVDADHFKELNDTHGHDAGDLVLCELARTLQNSLRNDDIVCRLGGDEFFIICPNTDEHSGINIAEIIRETVSKLRIPTGGETWHGSISVGVASRTPALKSYEELIKIADRGVYKAKNAGKNCVRTTG